MTHLKIEQNTLGIEEVNHSIISKLYLLTSNGTLDNSSNLKGRLHSNGAYLEDVNYLTQRFNQLYINIDKEYLKFEDPLVEQIIKNNWFSGHEGLTKNDLNTITKIATNNTEGPFIGTDIEYFDEYQYFGIASDRLGFGIYNCPKLKHITFPYITSYDGPTYFGNYLIQDTCPLLEKIIWQTGPNGEYTKINFSTGLNYKGCTNLTYNDKIVPLIKNIPTNLFMNCTSLEKMIFMEGSTGVSASVFSGCTGIRYIEYPSTITSLGVNGTHNGVVNCSIVYKSAVPPSLSGQSYMWNNFFGLNNCVSNGSITSNANTVYVPDASVTSYISTWKQYRSNAGGAASFDTFCDNQIKPLSTLPAAIRALGTVTQEDIDRVANNT